MRPQKQTVVHIICTAAAGHISSFPMWPFRLSRTVGESGTVGALYLIPRSITSSIRKVRAGRGRNDVAGLLT